MLLLFVCCVVEDSIITARILIYTHRTPLISAQLIYAHRFSAKCIYGKVYLTFYHALQSIPIFLHASSTGGSWDKIKNERKGLGARISQKNMIFLNRKRA